MIAAQEVTLDIAALQDSTIVANLVQLYAHDLSDVFALDVGLDGRFVYDKLPLYWTEPESRFPFLLRRGAQVVGFALVTRGSPTSEDPDVFDVAEFFVLRRYRRSAVGRRAAFLLWDRFGGSWTVRVSEGNRGALPFWTGIIHDYTNGAFTQSLHPGSPHPWQVFCFDSSIGRASPS